jgi:hypothetical protein
MGRERERKQITSKRLEIEIGKKKTKKTLPPFIKWLPKFDLMDIEEAQKVVEESTLQKEIAKGRGNKKLEYYLDICIQKGKERVRELEAGGR